MLNYTCKQEGDSLTVSMEGRLDTNTSPEFQGKIEPLLDQVSEVHLDFQGIDYVSSAGLRVLLAVLQMMEEKGGRLELSHVNDNVRDMFDITGFLDILTIV